MRRRRDVIERRRKPEDGRAGARPFCLLSSVVCLLLFWFLPGCGPSQQSTTQPSTVYDRQQQALRDPFGYTPDLKKSDMNVSGEGDNGAGLRRDLEHVANP